MTSYYNSGYLTFRERKIGIVFSGETAEHIMDNFLTDGKAHPLKHIKIQQLAKSVKQWNKSGYKRYDGLVTDNKTGIRFRIITEIHVTFAIIVTCYKY